MSARVDALRALCGRSRDGALLRAALANALVEAGANADAIVELRRALEFDPGYSAAWKQLGKLLAESGDVTAAIGTYRSGIAAAQKRGDKQAEKEMNVFLRRLEKSGA
jgi:tetratricopeptide (TPR) repeat protein